MNLSQDTKKMNFTQQENNKKKNIFSIEDQDLDSQKDMNYYSVNNMNCQNKKDEVGQLFIDQLVQICSQQITTEKKIPNHKKPLPSFNKKQNTEFLSQIINDFGKVMNFLDNGNKKIVQNFMEVFLENQNSLDKAIQIKDQDILIDCLQLDEKIQHELIHFQKQPDLFQIVLKLIVYKLFKPKFLLTEEIQEQKFIVQSYQKISKYQFDEEQQMLDKKYVVEDPQSIIEEFFVRLYNYNEVVDNLAFDQRNVNQITTIEGMVLKVSTIRVAATGMEFKCQECGFKVYQKFKEFVYKNPKKCESCTCKIFYPIIQTATVDFFQKAVVKCKIKNIQKNIDVQLELSLVDSIKIGDRVRVLGIIRPEFVGRDEYFGKNKSTLGAIYSYYIQANSIVKLDQVIEIPKDQQIKDNYTQFSDLTEQQQITSQYIFPGYVNNPVVIENQLYFQQLHQLEKDIFLEILDKKIVFECLVAFFCPNQVNNLMEKALIVLSNIYQNDPIHMIFIGGNYSIKLSLMKFAEKVAIKTIKDTQINLFPSFDKHKGYQNSINPGRIALADKGIICLPNLQQFEKKQLLSLKLYMENQKLFLQKYPQTKQIKCCTSLLASADYDKVSRKLYLPEDLVQTFDLRIFVKDQRKQLLKSVSNNLFKKNYQSQHQSQFQNFEEENFTSYIKQRIKDQDILNKYKILENAKIYKKFLRFVQNNIDPQLSKQNCEYIKEFYVELKNDFKLNEKQLNIQFFKSLLKLIKARAKIDFKKQVSMELIDEMIELAKEYLINNFKDQFEQTGSNNKNHKQQKPLSEAKKQKVFLQKLKEITENTNQEIFEIQELEQISDFHKLQITGFSKFIEKLNREGVLLKESKDTYRVYGL